MISRLFTAPISTGQHKKTYPAKHCTPQQAQITIQNLYNIKAACIKRYMPYRILGGTGTDQTPA